MAAGKPQKAFPATNNVHSRVPLTTPAQVGASSHSTSCSEAATPRISFPFKPMPQLCVTTNTNTQKYPQHLSFHKKIKKSFSCCPQLLYAAAGSQNHKHYKPRDEAREQTGLFRAHVFSNKAYVAASAHLHGRTEGMSITSRCH